MTDAATADNASAGEDGGIVAAVAAWLDKNVGQMLVKQLTLTDVEGEAIRDDVSKRFQDFLVENASQTPALAKAEFARQLIQAAAKKASIVGGITSFPFRLPLVGYVGPFIVALGVHISFLIRTQLELVYSLAALFDYPWSRDDLKSVAFVLVGMSDYDDVKRYAANLGVKITVKKLVAKLAPTIAVELVAYGIRGVSGPMMARIIAQRTVATSLLLAPVRYAGVGLGAYFAFSSTRKVGARAISFFTEDGGE